MFVHLTLLLPSLLIWHTSLLLTDTMTYLHLKINTSVKEPFCSHVNNYPYQEVSAAICLEGLQHRQQKTFSTHKEADFLVECELSDLFELNICISSSVFEEPKKEKTCSEKGTKHLPDELMVLHKSKYEYENF